MTATQIDHAFNGSLEKDVAENTKVKMLTRAEKRCELCNSDDKTFVPG